MTTVDDLQIFLQNNIKIKEEILDDPCPQCGFNHLLYEIDVDMYDEDGNEITEGDEDISIRTANFLGFNGHGIFNAIYEVFESWESETKENDFKDLAEEIWEMIYGEQDSMWTEEEIAQYFSKNN